MKKRFFDLARKLSKKSLYKHKLGCIIVRKNKVIGVGFNSVKTHTRSLHPFAMIHAELDALLSCGSDNAVGCDAYIYRETKDGKKALAKPCKFCDAMLRRAGIKRVFYTTNDSTELVLF